MNVERVLGVGFVLSCWSTKRSVMRVGGLGPRRGSHPPGKLVEDTSTTEAMRGDTR